MIYRSIEATGTLHPYLEFDESWNSVDGKYELQLGQK